MSFFDELKASRLMIMGVVNVTPDSFSDGGAYNNHAAQHGLKLLEQGADILDIGGESTRPHADVVSVQDEIARVVPVIEGLAGKAKYISIDTRNSETMSAAVQAGANIINDVSGLRHDPESVGVVAQSGLPICIMHMQGTPQTMQNAPEYKNVIDDICAFFEERLAFCAVNGVAQNRVILDPGIGFGKTLEHNLEIVARFDEFKKFGCPLLFGASRKSFIAKISDAPEVQDRLAGSLAAALTGVQNGADIVRGHDVFETRQAIDVSQALRSVG